jgi:hypothetical protein
MIVILLILPILAIFLARLLYLGLKRTYHTQRIALPGLLIWLGVLMAGVFVISMLLFLFGFGLSLLFF